MEESFWFYLLLQPNKFWQATPKHMKYFIRPTIRTEKRHWSSAFSCRGWTGAVGALVDRVPDCGGCNRWHGLYERLFSGTFRRRLRGPTSARELWSLSSRCLTETRTCGESAVLLSVHIQRKSIATFSCMLSLQQQVDRRPHRSFN